MNHKNYRTLFISVFTLSTYFCQSQNIQHRNKILSAAKAKLDSLYPHARGIYWHQTRDSEMVEFGCNCGETIGKIILTFDTNAYLLNKEVHYPDMKNLPDTILNYMKKNTSSSMGFDHSLMIKSINNKGEISYSIFMHQLPVGGGSYYEDYLLKFKPTGELISSEKQEPELR